MNSAVGTIQVSNIGTGFVYFVNSTLTNLKLAEPLAVLLPPLRILTMEGGRRTDPLLCEPPFLGLKRWAKFLPHSDTSRASIRGVACKFINSPIQYNFNSYNATQRVKRFFRYENS